VIDYDRRRFLGTAAMTIATAQLGGFGSATAQGTRAEPGATPMKPGKNPSFAPLKQIDAGVLNVGYAEAGPASGTAVLLLHGWPYDIHAYAVVAGVDWGARTADIVAALWPERVKALVSVSGYLIGSQAAGKIPLPPSAELQWWYQYYFATERGRLGYDKYRHDFASLIWKLASPKWNFDDATFDRSAASLDNPDHVSIVIHNYRWRLGLAEGEAKYDDLEKRLAGAPVIKVPTITLEGDGNGAPHPDASAYAKKFSGKYSHRLIKGGIGHNLPQEAPRAFADAVVAVDGYARRSS
jgi:pimeloyl-ACP methyl ester carboxylesterase